MGAVALAKLVPWPRIAVGKDVTIEKAALIRDLRRRNAELEQTIANSEDADDVLRTLKRIVASSPSVPNTDIFGIPGVSLAHSSQI